MATVHTSAQNGHKGTPPVSTQLQHPAATGHNGAAHSQKQSAGSRSDGQLSWTTEERESESPHTNGQDHAHNGRDHAPKKGDHHRSRWVCDGMYVVGVKNHCISSHFAESA